MNQSKQFSTILLAAGFSLLAWPALAQGTNPGSTYGSPSDLPPSSTTPSSSSGVRNNSSTVPSSTAPSGTDVNTSRSNVTPGVNNSPRAGTQTALSFDQLDANNDGGITLSEFTQSATRSAVAGSGSAMDSTGSSGTASTQGNTIASANAGNQSAHYTADQFRALDRNHDGILTRSELSAMQSTAAPAQP